MARVNYPLTIDQLIEEAIKAKRKFGGDKYVLLSDDEEGNGFHECYYSFAAASDFFERSNFDLDLENCVVLG